LPLERKETAPLAVIKGRGKKGLLSFLLTGKRECDDWRLEAIQFSCREGVPPKVQKASKDELID